MQLLFFIFSTTPPLRGIMLHGKPAIPMECTSQSSINQVVSAQSGDAGEHKAIPHHTPLLLSPEGLTHCRG